MALTPAVSALIGLGGAFGAQKLMGGSNKSEAPSPIPLPQAPSPAESVAQATEVVKRKKAAASQTIYTSPLGASGQADVAKKVLLGQ